MHGDDLCKFTFVKSQLELILNDITSNKKFVEVIPLAVSIRQSVGFAYGRNLCLDSRVSDGGSSDAVVIWRLCMGVMTHQGRDYL